MGIGADMLYRHDDFCNPLARNGLSGGAVRQI